MARMESNLCQALLAAPPERIAIVDGEAETTYGELAAHAATTAAALAAAGAGRGDRVGILAPRGAAAAGAYFGTLAAGCVAVILNEQLRPRQIDYILDHSGASVLLAERGLLDRLPRPLESEVTTLDIEGAGPGDGFEPAGVAADEVAQIIYTSGSTGRPKGVTLSHGNLVAGTSSVVSYLGIRAEDRIASLLPFTFDYGLNQLHCAVATGATLVVERTPMAARIVRTLRDRDVSVVAGVPPLWLQLLQVEAFRSEPLPALRVMTNSGGRVPVTAVKELRRSQPQAQLFLMYGLTEAFRSTYLDPERVDVKPESIGRAIPGAEVFVVDAEGSECRPAEVGELVHSGPTVALGYWRDPETTARVYRPDPRGGSDLVVYSGDRAYRDEDGDLFFMGREDTLIKTLGYRVSPDEVVEVLHASGEVAEAVVSSEPDELRGERIVAHVVLAAAGDLGRLEEYATRELPRYMQPSRIEVRDELARTVSGKHDAAAYRT